MFLLRNYWPQWGWRNVWNGRKNVSRQRLQLYRMCTVTVVEGSVIIFRPVWLEHRGNMAQYVVEARGMWLELFRLHLMMPSSIKTYGRFISEFSKGYWLEIGNKTKICIINVRVIILNVVCCYLRVAKAWNNPRTFLCMTLKRSRSLRNENLKTPRNSG